MKANLYGVIGYPIHHSMSPSMHNTAFRALGLNHHYHAFEVNPNRLGEAIKGMKALGIAGFNVTIPHKVEVMKHIDEIDEEARMIGAVNTVVRHEDRFIGYNTDGQGYLRALLNLVSSPLQQYDVLVIGAGGAARAIVTSLANHGVASLTIANRTVEKAQALAYDVSTLQPCHTMTLTEAEAALGSFHIVINTTSVGMHPHTDAVPINLAHMREGTILSDLIYNPLKTTWLQEGEQRGAVIDNGLSMFVGQGALAFEKWTGQQPNQERMSQHVIEQLGGR